MYKLVAIDLDGTLLNSYGEVSEKNKEAIQKAKNRKKQQDWTEKSNGLYSIFTMEEELCQRKTQSQ